MKIDFLPEAALDVVEAVTWYNSRRPKRGVAFRAQYKAALHQIQRMPFSRAKLSSGIRKAHLASFPYAIQYLIDRQETTILVIGIFHHSRHPSRGAQRLK